MDVFSIAVGAAGVGCLYFLYLASSKGLPAALAWLKAKWNAGKADLAGLQGDVVDVKSKLASIETVALNEIKNRLAAIEGAIGLTKPSPVAANPAPSFLQPPAAPSGGAA